MTDSGSSLPSHAPTQTERSFTGYFWLILKNLIGWTLILVSFVVGPLIPGPGGIPLFLIGFALVTFPGKRRLTARVLRGRRLELRSRSLVLSVAVFSLVVPVLVLSITESHWSWLHALLRQGLLGAVAAHVLGIVITALLSYIALLLVNLLLRAMPPVRRHVRPWLRKHRIHLLPPRRRRRLAHEPGTGPLRLKDEILLFLKRSRPVTPKDG